MFKLCDASKQRDTPNAQKCQIRLRFISILSILWWVSNEVGGLLGLGEIHQIDFNTHFKEYIKPEKRTLSALLTNRK